MFWWTVLGPFCATLHGALTLETDQAQLTLCRNCMMKHVLFSAVSLFQGGTCLRKSQGMSRRMYGCKKFFERNDVSCFIRCRDVHALLSWPPSLCVNDTACAASNSFKTRPERRKYLRPWFNEEVCCGVSLKDHSSTQFSSSSVNHKR